MAVMGSAQFLDLMFVGSKLRLLKRQRLQPLKKYSIVQWGTENRDVGVRSQRFKNAGMSKLRIWVQIIGVKLWADLMASSRQFMHSKRSFFTLLIKCLNEAEIWGRSKAVQEAPSVRLSGASSNRAVPPRKHPTLWVTSPCRPNAPSSISRCRRYVRPTRPTVQEYPSIERGFPSSNDDHSLIAAHAIDAAPCLGPSFDTHEDALELDS